MQFMLQYIFAELSKKIITRTFSYFNPTNNFFYRWEEVNKAAGEWIAKMEGLVAMWEKQAATAEKVILMPGWIFLFDVSQIYCPDVLWIYY
jgi:hypothetical protein